MKLSMEELNAICMEMICNAGEGRGMVFEALDAVNANNYELAEEKLNKAQESLAEAHRIQFEQLMGPQNSGTEMPFSLLLLHAMDLTMVSTSEHDLLRSIVTAKLAEGKE